MLHYTDDPIRDAEVAQMDAERWLDSRPTCELCGQPIQEDYYFRIDDMNICEYCWDPYIRANFLKIIEE